MGKVFIAQEIVQECRMKLLSLKQDLLHRIRQSKEDFKMEDKTMGDEIDQTVAQQNENSFLISQERMRAQIYEVEFALARIEKGIYGLCEETEEPIEIERLRTIPYTRLSIEGAEIRERLNRKFAKLS